MSAQRHGTPVAPRRRQHSRICAPEFPGGGSSGCLSRSCGAFVTLVLVRERRRFQAWSFEGALHLLRAVQMLIGAAEVFKGFHYLSLFAQIIGIGIKSELPVVDHGHELVVGALARGALWRAGPSDLGFQGVPLRSQPLVKFV